MTVLLSLAMIQLSIFWYWYNFEKTLQDEKHSYISKLKRPFGNNFNQQVYSLPSFIRDYPFLSFNSLSSIEILCNHCNICKVTTIVSLQSLFTFPVSCIRTNQCENLFFYIQTSLFSYQLKYFLLTNMKLIPVDEELNITYDYNLNNIIFHFVPKMSRMRKLLLFLVAQLLLFSIETLSYLSLWSSEAS